MSNIFGAQKSNALRAIGALLLFAPKSSILRASGESCTRDLPLIVRRNHGFLHTKGVHQLLCYGGMLIRFLSLFLKL